ncbi:MAG: hypothetical protein JNG88_14830, partial [Phycisphaerales bacterium]|nr:hypothetical protein [Phycisphaerales bacterium]
PCEATSKPDNSPNYRIESLQTAELLLVLKLILVAIHYEENSSAISSFGGGAELVHPLITMPARYRWQTAKLKRPFINR